MDTSRRLFLRQMPAAGALGLGADAWSEGAQPAAWRKEMGDPLKDRPTFKRP